ncbi:MULTISPECIES: NUDIX hydrolase [Pelosinus]|uniref:NUDIX hydrolase n=1 Tax=Pelosinus fermentans B4 TaxID=1149862 RepID=I9LE05_9FIRM|nr:MULTISPECIES: CoA pyrophosphatase [Pelosinus]EIW18694.1 NUDIX hydrolase [Pelosinus fermentans B4]EIW25188.1 NUDIX hydrolase [Pelosinus fermentans A11]OAM96479.1 NUDIX hydrolase [Pelosinus fermentans DSM 17108]SDR40591.1 NUDIX domain-containing protein [Pelosinus fermentans]
MDDLCREISKALAVNVESKAGYNEFFSAAVLVPLIVQDGELAVLFEVRSTQLSWQPGEICFPGGRIEKEDGSALAAAVRETQEELSLAAAEIKILGALDEIISPIGVKLHPYVGYLSPLHPIEPSQDEVAEVFTIPLRFLLAHKPIVAHMEMGTRPLADFPFSLVTGYSEEWRARKTYQVSFYKYKKHVVWGLTAQVLQGFLEIYKTIDDK